MNDIDALFLASLRYLNYRPRSEKEIRDYLKKKLVRLPAVTTSVVDLIVTRLKTQKFLNDLEFATMWIRSRTEFKPKGERLIRLELSQKGVNKEIIDQAFREYDTARQKDNEEKRDELFLVKEILVRKKRKYQGMEKEELFRKAGSMLARKGFDLDTIKNAIDQIFGK